MRFYFFVCATLFFISCGTSRQSQKGAYSGQSNAADVSRVSTDETYGYTEANPVKVGGGNSGPANERAYLDQLTGPNGEEVTYQRKGSCCQFKTPNGLIGGMGLLDRYEVSYAGLEKPVILFINMYDKGTLKAPRGFLMKN